MASCSESYASGLTIVEWSVSKTVEEFVAAAHTQAAVTHTSPNVLKATDFFSHVLWEVAVSAR